MKVQVEISGLEVPEEEVLRRIREDWGYEGKKPRAGKTNFSFYDADTLTYSVATITSPEEYKGKIAGYSGLGEYQDLLVDAGTYVLGGASSTKGGTPDFRGQGISTKVRNVRDAAAESKASSKPYCIIVIAGPNGYTRHLESKGYELKSKGIPDWAIERVAQKYYLVYNPNTKVEKSWKEILKFDRDVSTWGEIEPTIYNKTGERARVMPRSIMLDYFKMYKRMHNRVPTLEEIEEEEERPLTVDEINEYHREYMRTIG